MINFFRRMFLQRALDSLIRFFASYPRGHYMRETEPMILSMMWGLIQLEANHQKREHDEKQKRKTA